MAAPTDSPGGGEGLAQPEAEPAPTAVPAVPPTPADAAPPPPVAAAGFLDRIRRLDFRQPAFLSPSGLRRLRLRHEEFVRSLSARLSIYLRLEFSVRLVKLHTTSYREFAQSLPKPAHVTLFKAEPLRGIGLLEIPRTLGMGIVDRLLGGPPQSATTEHEFSEIEVALLDQVMHLVLTEWCDLWSDLQVLQPTLLGHEDDGTFLKTAPHDAVMLVVVMETKVGEGAGQVQLAIPCHSLEPFVRQLAPLAETAPAETPVLVPSLRWNRGFDDVPVSVTAMWNDLEMTARQVANLKPGDFLPLDAECTRKVKLRLADLAKFEGNLGTTNGKWAVAVTGVGSPALEN